MLNAYRLSVHKTPLVGYGDRKTFVVMPLEADEPKVEPGKVTVLASDAMPSVLLKSAEPVHRAKPSTEKVVAPSVCRSIKQDDKARLIHGQHKLLHF